jgi:dTMP kinase
MRKKGFFITFEGIDGSGKTTQLLMTEKYLRQHGLDVLVLREPGSTSLAEKIRKILLDKRNSIPPQSELSLYLAARADLVQKVIAPALKSGKIVLCDRFYDSTTAYQGYGRKLDIALIKKLNHLTVGATIPDITFIIDVDFETSLQRRKKESDRLESESKKFFESVRRGFLAIGREEKKRVCIIDGRITADATFAEVIGCLKRKLKIA